jgi:phenylpropionate dioxygenase-like ring-hydroxylating dioxygenase large terminal subunit
MVDDPIHAGHDDEPTTPARRQWEATIARRTDVQAPDRVGASRSVHGTGSAPEDLPYELVDRSEPPPVPNGWYAAVGSEELGTDRSQTIVAVQRELVVFRDRAGAARVVAAHCPHMGAHLGGGAVRGGRLTCPYHGWEFDGDGRCVRIPYSDTRIPARACVRSFPTREQDGLVLFWYHAGGAEPQWEVPVVGEVDDPTWSPAHVHHGELVASLQDMAENNVDYTHFFFVHRRERLDDSSSRFTTDGPFSTVVEHFDGEGLVFTRHAYGPGIAVLRVPDLMTVLTATTPIDRRHVRLRWHFHFPVSMEGISDAMIASVVDGYGLAADAPIWRDKAFVARPLLVRGDGPIAELRRWYAQFYEGC